MGFDKYYGLFWTHFLFGPSCGKNYPGKYYFANFMNKCFRGNIKYTVYCFHVTMIKSLTLIGLIIAILDMAEIRLNKLIKEYNIGLDDLVDFLRQNWVDIDANPNAKISAELLPLINDHFLPDKTAKDNVLNDVELQKILEASRRGETEEDTRMSSPSPKEPSFSNKGAKWQGYLVASIDWYDTEKGFGIAHPRVVISSDPVRYREIFIHHSKKRGSFSLVNNDDTMIIIEAIAKERGKISALLWHGFDGSESSYFVLSSLFKDGYVTCAFQLIGNLPASLDVSGIEPILDLFIKEKKQGIPPPSLLEIRRRQFKKRPAQQNESIIKVIDDVTKDYVNRLSNEELIDGFMNDEIPAYQLPDLILNRIIQDLSIPLSRFCVSEAVFVRAVEGRTTMFSNSFDLEAFNVFLNDCKNANYSTERFRTEISEVAVLNLGKELIKKYSSLNSDGISIVDIEALNRGYTSICFDVLSNDTQYRVKSAIASELNVFSLPISSHVAAFSYGFTENSDLSNNPDCVNADWTTVSRIKSSHRSFDDDDLVNFLAVLVGNDKYSTAFNLLDGSISVERHLECFSIMLNYQEKNFNSQSFYSLSSYYKQFSSEQKNKYDNLFREKYLLSIDDLFRQEHTILGSEYSEGSINYLISHIPFAGNQDLRELAIQKISSFLSASSINLYIEACIDSNIRFIGWDNVPDWGELSSHMADRAFGNICTTKEQKEIFIQELVNHGHCKEALTFSKNTGDKDLWARIDNVAHTSMPTIDYFELWKDCLALSFVPVEAAEYIKTNLGSATQVLTYILQKEGISAFSETARYFVDADDVTKDRKTFQRYLISWGVAHDRNDVQLPIIVPASVCQAIDWLYYDGEDVEDNSIRIILPLLNPLDQRQLLKKYFYTRKRLRQDVDLLMLNELFTPSEKQLGIIEDDCGEELFDLSARVVICAMLKFKTEGKFLAGKELFDIFWAHKDFSLKAKYHISGFFDECAGRAVISNYYDLYGDCPGEIIERPDGFIVRFYDGTGWNTISPIKDQIKSIYGSRYNPADRTWSVIKEKRQPLINIAKENRLKLILLDGDMDSNNAHLQIIKRRDKLGKFCSGRYTQNNKGDDAFWCSGAYCHACAIKRHDEDDWTNYSMFDFCCQMNFDMTEYSKYYSARYGLYMQFIGTVNWLNQAISHFYCRKCHDFIKPMKSAEYARHSVVRFSCQDVNCKNYSIPVYINTCLNNDCRSIIDSRDSAQCPNGLYICPECGQCCSNDSLERRLRNLESVGGYIPEQLRVVVERHMGHREYDTYFCFRCGTKMEDAGGNKFICPKCQYELQVKKRYKQIQ